MLFSCLLCGLKKEEDREDKLNSLRHDETNDVHFKLLAGIIPRLLSGFKIKLFEFNSVDMILLSSLEGP